MSRKQVLMEIIADFICKRNFLGRCQPVSALNCVMVRDGHHRLGGHQDAQGVSTIRPCPVQSSHFCASS